MNFFKKCLMLFSFSINLALAGSISDGNWKPANCGESPKPPTVKDNNVDAYNDSVKDINAWQQQARTYFDCLVKEANTDNSIIADSANREQAGYRETVEKISAELNAAGKKLDKK